MAKKIVRGITDVKTINNQDFDTNNVNDLLSDGQYNYIHRKKGKSEEYHNLTDNIKTISSDNTDLLAVTNNNKTNNTATLHPKHDAQKEQVLESTRNTISIHHGTNGTDEKTTVDTNPQKVLEHTNLLTDYGISKNTTGNTTKLGLEYTLVPDNFDFNTLEKGRVRCSNPVNAPLEDCWFFVSACSGYQVTFQNGFTVKDGVYRFYKRFKSNGSWGAWREQVGDKSVIDSLLTRKQNTLTSNASIGVFGTTLRQLYASKENYSNSNGTLKTYVKWVNLNTALSEAPQEEFHFTLMISRGVQQATFNITPYDKQHFTSIISSYGQSNTVNIGGCKFTLSDTTLTVSTGDNTENNYVITFSDIL